MRANVYTPVLVAVILLLSLSGLAQIPNTIEGRVTAPGNISVDHIVVFLLSDTYSQIRQTYTDGSGRYQFRGVQPASYYVEVDPGGLGLERQRQRIEAIPYDPTGRGGGEIFRLDINLRPDKKAQTTGSLDIPGANRVVFAQVVPPAAKEAFEKGSESLKKEDLKMAELNLLHAIELFPDYFDALDLLGTEYVKHSFYDSAEPLLARAVAVNKDAWHCYYGLGVSLLELGRHQEGIEALRHSTTLNPGGINAAMRLGMELAKDPNFSDEAIKLLTVATQTAGKDVPDSYLVLASLQSKQQHFREAATALEGYLQTSPPADQREKIKSKIEELKHKQAQSKSGK